MYSCRSSGDMKSKGFTGEGGGGEGGAGGSSELLLLFVVLVLLIRGRRNKAPTAAMAVPLDEIIIAIPT